MDPYFVTRTMEDDVISDVTVTDVYDQAAGIGKEFEKLIETYGVESVTDLMPKVIRVLEQLEALASKYEQESNEISGLKFAVDKLESEKADKVLERARFEEELIQIEETWQSESKEQLTLIAHLQEENRRLRTSLSEQKTAVVEEVAAITKKTEEKEIEVLTKLKQTVDKQREDIRKQTRENKQKNVDIDALQTQSERLVKINIELRRKNSTHRKHARTILSDKVELESQLAEKERQIQNVTDFLPDQELIDDRIPHSDGKQASDAGSTGKERLHSITESDDGSYDVDSGVSMATGTTATKDGVQTELENPEHLMQKLSMVRKAIFDKQDPNRPRFTLNDLRTVLMERNEIKLQLLELKGQMLEVEEELDSYKPKLPSDFAEYVIVNNNTNAQVVGELACANNEDEEEEEEEYVVQGPINKEPDEKLYPDRKRPSGIRRFFSSLFGDDPPRDQRHRPSTDVWQ